MTLRGASLLLIALLVSACGGTGGNGDQVTRSAAVIAATPTSTPLIDVYDMMGAFPPATFFVSTKDGIKAIALLNHATRYTIPATGPEVQVAAAGASGRVYVLDQITQGARLRWFDIDNGTERASRILPGLRVKSTGIGHGGLAIDDAAGTVYALLIVRDSGAIAVDEFDWFTLKPSRTVLTSACGERVAAAAGRVAVACFKDKDGALIVADGAAQLTLSTGLQLSSMAMLGDGTLMAGDLDGHLVRLARHQTTLEAVRTLRDYGAKLIPDGIAVNAGCCFYLGILDPQANDVQVRAIAGGMMLVAFPSIAQPVGGLFVQAPFAYYIFGGRARHIDINQGFQEVMAEIGDGAVPGAVSNR